MTGMTVKQCSLNKLELHKKKNNHTDRSYRSVTIVQNVTLRTAGRTHTGPLTLCNKTAWGQLTALIQALPIRQQVNLMTVDRTHAGPLPLDNKSAYGNPVVIIQAGHHYVKWQPKNSPSHSHMPIAIRQQDSTRTADRTYTDPRH
jgi:hypothetical protein